MVIRERRIPAKNIIAALREYIVEVEVGREEIEGLKIFGVR